MEDVLNLHAFKDQSGGMGRLAYDLGNAYKQLAIIPFNASGLFQMLYFFEAPLFCERGRLAGLTYERIGQTQEWVQGLEAGLQALIVAPNEETLAVRELVNAAQLLDHACRLGMSLLTPGQVRRVDQLAQCEKVALRSHLESAVSNYRELWLERNRMGGLVESTARFEKLLNAYAAK